MNVDKLRALGWEPRYQPSEAVAEAVRWYRDNDWWWRPLRERYSGERLGLLKSAKS